jgi:hypothetical protein
LKSIWQCEQFTKIRDTVAESYEANVRSDSRTVNDFINNWEVPVRRILKEIPQLVGQFSTNGIKYGGANRPLIQSFLYFDMMMQIHSRTPICSTPDFLETVVKPRFFPDYLFKRVSIHHDGGTFWRLTVEFSFCDGRMETDQGKMETLTNGNNVICYGPSKYSNVIRTLEHGHFIGFLKTNVHKFNTNITYIGDLGKMNYTNIEILLDLIGFGGPKVASLLALEVVAPNDIFIPFNMTKHQAEHFIEQLFVPLWVAPPLVLFLCEIAIVY